MLFQNHIFPQLFSSPGSHLSFQMSARQCSSSRQTRISTSKRRCFHNFSATINKSYRFLFIFHSDLINLSQRQFRLWVMQSGARRRSSHVMVNNWTTIISFLFLSFQLSQRSNANIATYIHIPGKEICEVFWGLSWIFEDYEYVIMGAFGVFGECCQVICCQDILISFGGLKSLKRSPFVGRADLQFNWRLRLRGT